MNMDVLIKWRKGWGGEIWWSPFHLTCLFNGVLFVSIQTRAYFLQLEPGIGIKISHILEKFSNGIRIELVYAHEPEHGTEFPLLV